jgi:hypothetical protein
MSGNLWEFDVVENGKGEVLSVDPAAGGIYSVCCCGHSIIVIQFHTPYIQRNFSTDNRDWLFTSISIFSQSNRKSPTSTTLDYESNGEVQVQRFWQCLRLPHSRLFPCTDELGRFRCPSFPSRPSQTDIS